jgi:glycosyltransferase involved in cell wall biosynthesis
MNADVCLVLEGSYPYIRGGVSAWVDDLVRGLPGTSFSVAHLRDEEGPSRPAGYARPANLVELRVLDADPERVEPEAELVDRLPEADVYHALSTGLAGLAAAAGASTRGCPMLLTEHGLAWREARYGLFGCKPHVAGCKPHRFPEHLDRERWAEVVESSARSAYRQAAAITTVCRQNARLQVGQGADSRRLRVISNSAPQPANVTARSGVLAAPRIGFVGRVVAIKDVETFLRACRLVADELPEAELAVVGPLDHEPEYAGACVELAESLGLADRIRFTGETDVAPWYRRLDVVALTSVSEAQPLVLLEAMAAGVPVVATAVGGCPELVRGAGLLTPPRDPRATARAILELCSDPSTRSRLVRAALARVRRDHDRGTMLRSYNELYERLAA